MTIAKMERLHSHAYTLRPKPVTLENTILFCV